MTKINQKLFAYAADKMPQLILMKRVKMEDALMESQAHKRFQ